jgi:Calcium binding
MTKRHPVRAISAAELDAMIEEATVDCYNESEQATGLFTMLEEHLRTPFETSVLGITVRVDRVDLNEDDSIVAICSRDQSRQTIPILDLPLPEPAPAGAEWIMAYRRWLRGA